MRIWITGIGVVSPLGRDAPRSVDRLLAGERAIAPLTLFEAAGCRSQLAAQVPDLSAADVAPRGASETWSRTDAMAVLAAREALAHAALGQGGAPIDLILGGTTAGMFETEGLLAEMHHDPDAREPLRAMLSHPLSATVDRLRDVVAPFRQARTVCSACSSGSNALLLAASWLRSGRSQRVLAGGADGLCRLTYCGFSALGALSPEPCRPFDVARDGLSLGEAAAFLVVETEASARERGAEPIAELRGWAVGAEGHHITNPQASGETAARVMAAALGRAQLEAADIGYVNAHGTATKLNDAMEASALARCFGDALPGVAVSSTKGQVGHTLGAAGALEAAITVSCLARRRLPPTVGLEQPDPACALDHVREPREANELRAAMSNSFGFGGSDAVLVFAQPEAFAPIAAEVPRKVWVTGAATMGPLGVRSAVDSREYLRPGAPAPPGSIAFEAKEHLDLGRARRIDRSGRMTTVAMQEALRAAGYPSDEPARSREAVGAISGSAFGAVDGCSAYVARIYEKGARYASPAVFPNLLPSSPVAHASIYLSLGGAVFASADLAATAESAIVTAAELIEAGEVQAMLAGGVEEQSHITETVLGPLCTSEPLEGARSEGAIAVLFETRGEASDGVLAELSWWAGWRGEPADACAAMPALREPGRARLIVRSALAPLDFLPPGWAAMTPTRAHERAGFHECAGGFGLVAGIGELAEGDIDQLLVIGTARDRGYALLFERPPGAVSAS
jgi:3-oxoacyl-[acyl-carrier-protein] synthase II